MLCLGKKIYIPTSSEQREIDRDISMQRERERESINEGERQTDRHTYIMQERQKGGGKDERILFLT